MYKMLAVKLAMARKSYFIPKVLDNAIKHNTSFEMWHEWHCGKNFYLFLK